MATTRLSKDTSTDVDSIMSLQRSITNDERPRNVLISDFDVDEAAGLVSSFGKSDADEEQKFGRRTAKRRRLTSMSGIFQMWDTPAPMMPAQPATQSEDDPEDGISQAASPSPASPSVSESPPAIQTRPSPSPAVTAGLSDTADDENALAAALTPTQNDGGHLSPAPSTPEHDTHTYANDDSHPSSSSSSESDSPIPTPTPTPAPARRSNKRGWSLAQECALEESVRYVIEEQDGRNETVREMWRLVSKRFENLHGFAKNPGACRSWWNRWLRAETGFDERKTPNQGQMVTSSQGGNKSGA